MNTAQANEKRRITNQRMQSVLSLMSDTEAEKELAAWREGWSNLERIDEAAIYAELPAGMY